MPYPQPHSLSDPEVYALVAYLLNLNGVIAKDAVMNATTLPPRPDAQPRRLRARLSTQAVAGRLKSALLNGSSQMEDG